MCAEIKTIDDDWLTKGLTRRPRRAFLDEKVLEGDVLSSIKDTANRLGRIPATTLDHYLCVVTADSVLQYFSLDVKSVRNSINLSGAKIIDIASSGSYLGALDIVNNALQIVMHPISVSPIVRSFELKDELDSRSRICRKDDNSFLISFPRSNKVQCVSFGLQMDVKDVPDIEFDLHYSVPGLSGPISWDVSKSTVVLAIDESLSPLLLLDWNTGRSSTRSARINSAVTNFFSLGLLLDGMFGIQKQFKDASVILLTLKSSPYLMKLILTETDSKTVSFEQAPICKDRETNLVLSTLWGTGCSLILHFLGEETLKIWIYKGSTPIGMDTNAVS